MFITKPRLFTPSFHYSRSVIISSIGILVFFLVNVVFLNFVFHPTQSANSLYLRETLRQDFPVLKELLTSQSNFEQTVRSLDNESVTGFTVQPDSSNQEASASSRLNVFFPDNYTRFFEIKVGSVQLKLRALESTKVAAQIEDGSIVYRNAYAQTDILNIIAGQQSKEFLLLKSLEAPTTFEYELQANSGVTAQIQNGSVQFISEKNSSLHIDAPWLIDSQGKRYEAESVIHWELEESGKSGAYKLRLKLNPTGLSYPLAIDPSWSIAGYLNSFRRWPTATLLQNGKVLVTGGTYDGTNADKSTELYNPATNSWSIASEMKTARFGHQAILLGNGKVLVAGGTGLAVNPLSSAELYDPTSGTWSYTGNVIYPGATGSLVTLQNGKILRVSSYNAADIYDPATGTWSTTGPFSGPHAKAAVVLPSGKVLVAGVYQTGPSIAATANLYDPVSNTWRFTGQPHYGYVGDNLILLNNGKVLAVGDHAGASQIYDPAIETWTYTSPTNTSSSDYTVSLLPSGQVVLVGSAHDTSDNVFDTLIYDPPTNVWTIGPKLNTTRTAHSAVLLANGKLMVIGGVTTNGPMNTSAEILDLTTVSPTSITLTSSFNPAYAGQPVDIVASFDRTYGLPPGSVTFKEGATVLGTAPISNAKAKITISNFTAGTHAITAEYGGSTYYLASTSPQLNLQVVQSNTTLAMTTDTNPIGYGNNIILTVHATSPDGEPLGNVTLKEGNTVLDIESLVNGSVNFFFYSLPVGTHNLVAYYEGHQGTPGYPSFSPAATSVSLVVTKAPVNVSIDTSALPSIYGQPVSFFGSVSPTSGSSFPTGTVTIKDGTTSIGSTNIQAGSFSYGINISGLSAGTHSITAVYNGSSTHEAGTSPVLSKVIDKATSSITITTTNSSSVYGQSVTLTAKATSNTVPPVGTVTFKAGATTLGIATLDQNGIAVLTLSNLDSGSYTITVDYAGTANFTASSSNGISLTVNPASTSITIDSLANAALVGQPVTLTAVTRAILPSRGLPTGNVTFKEGSATLGTGSLDSYGVATLSLSNLSLGEHNITAIFGGSANFLTSNSTTLTQKIVQICSGQVVNTSSDNGAGTNCGTLSYAIKQAALQPAGSEPFLIGLNTSQLTLSVPLAVISNTNGVAIILNGGCGLQMGRGVPQVQLVKGSGAGTEGLAISNNVTIKGFAITGFTGSAIEVQGSNNTLACNWIGTPDGVTATANGSGVHILGSNNQLGLAGQPESGNLISGNTGASIVIEAGSKGNQAYYNWIGWQNNGSTPLKNGLGLKIMAGGQLNVGPNNLLHN